MDLLVRVPSKNTSVAKGSLKISHLLKDGSPKMFEKMKCKVFFLIIFCGK